MQDTNQHQEHGVHSDLWVLQLASSKTFKNKSTIINYLQWEKYVSFTKLLNGKMKQKKSYCCSGKVVLAPLHEPPQEFKELFESPSFLLNIRSYNSVFEVMSGRVTYRKCQD
jgi:hypothetical protein